MYGRTLRLIIFYCFCMLMKGAQCSPPKRKAEDLASSSTSTSRGAREQSPVTQFHHKLRDRAASTIGSFPEASNRSPNGPAEHKKALAKRIVEDIQGVKATDNVATIASFGLAFTAVVWRKGFKPEAARYLVYGNEVQRGNYHDAYLRSGTHPLNIGMPASKTYIPGLGSPAFMGASVFAPQAMHNGVIMSCMIFYMSMSRLIQRDMLGHTNMQSFRQAVGDCNGAELQRTGLNINRLTSPIDLDRLAQCMWRASKSNEHSPRMWKGIAAVAAYTLLGSHTSLHPDMGIWAPEGNIALEYATFAVPTVDLVSVDWVYVYIFSILE